MLVVGVEKLYFYYDSRYPFLVQTMFWGNILIPAAALVWSFVWLLEKYSAKAMFTFTHAASGAYSLLRPKYLYSSKCAVVDASLLFTAGNRNGNQYLLFVLVDLLFSSVASFFLQAASCSHGKNSHRHINIMRKTFSFSGRSSPN